MYKFVVFDLDGTLADTIEDLKNSVNDALAKNSLPIHTSEEYKTFVGNGVDKMVELASGYKKGTKIFENIKSGFESYYAEHTCDCTKPYDGMAELLKTLGELNIKTAVLSNKPNVYVPKVVGKLYPEHKFEFMLGQCKEFPRKPDPSALFFMMKESGVEKDETLYVGDSNVDVVTGHNGKVKVCGVSWGFRPVSELNETGADIVVDNAEELLEVIKAGKV